MRARASLRRKIIQIIRAFATQIRNAFGYRCADDHLLPKDFTLVNSHLFLRNLRDNLHSVSNRHLLILLVREPLSHYPSHEFIPFRGDGRLIG
jgi:hypothetical protein